MASPHTIDTLQSRLEESEAQVQEYKDLLQRVQGPRCLDAPQQCLFVPADDRIDGPGQHVAEDEPHRRHLRKAQEGTAPGHPEAGHEVRQKRQRLPD